MTPQKVLTSQNGSCPSLTPRRWSIRPASSTSAASSSSIPPPNGSKLIIRRRLLPAESVTILPLLLMLFLFIYLLVLGISLLRKEGRGREETEGKVEGGQGGGGEGDGGRRRLRRQSLPTDNVLVSHCVSSNFEQFRLFRNFPFSGLCLQFQCLCRRPRPSAVRRVAHPIAGAAAECNRLVERLFASGKIF